MQVTADNLDEVTREASRKYAETLTDAGHSVPSDAVLTHFESGFMTAISDALVDAEPPATVKTWRPWLVFAYGIVLGQLLRWDLFWEIWR